MQLNPQQQAAVEYISGPTLVLAGAGSGKTRVITEKIAYLVNSAGYKPHHIAAVTFTNKAAREMRERISLRLGRKNCRGLRVSTFHTLGLDMIRREVSMLGFKPGFSLFDDQDNFALLNALSEDSIDGDKSILQRLQQKISHWKNAMLLPEQVQPTTGDQEEQLFAELYMAYQRNMKACNALDFDDLILLPTLLLQRVPEV